MPDKSVITMEQAIKAATLFSADMLGLDDRGRIKEGLAADIAEFNPQTICDPAAYERPQQYSQGIKYLPVNGVLTIREGQYTGATQENPLSEIKARCIPAPKNNYGHFRLTKCTGAATSETVSTLAPVPPTSKNSRTI